MEKKKLLLLLALCLAFFCLLLRACRFTPVTVPLLEGETLRLLPVTRPCRLSAFTAAQRVRVYLPSGQAVELAPAQVIFQANGVKVAGRLVPGLRGVESLPGVAAGQALALLDRAAAGQ